MTLMLAEKDLYRACEVIFGSELDLSRDFLEYLQLSGVKSAYRKRALETHPDRCAALADATTASDAVRAADELKNGVLFHDVRQAYENLVNYLQAREKGVILLPASGFTTRRQPTAARRPARPRPEFYRRPTRPAGGNGGGGGNKGNRSQTRANGGGGSSGGPCFWNLHDLYRGPLPRRRLLLGHFLYYAGIASWHTIVQALIWQRSRRPKIGEISRRFGLLDEETVAMILKNKNLRQPFGESARQMGLLDEQQLNLLITAQKRLQRKFGEYFVEQGLLQPAQLAMLLRRYHEHNATFHQGQ